MSSGHSGSAGNEVDRFRLSSVLTAGGESRSALSTAGNHNSLTVQWFEGLVERIQLFMHHAGKIEVKVFHEADVTNCVGGDPMTKLQDWKAKNDVVVRRH